MHVQSEVNSKYLPHFDSIGSYMQTFRSIRSMQGKNIGFRIEQISI